MEKQSLQKVLLVVEDDVALMGAIKNKFEMAEFKVLEAFNGQEGLEVVIKERPDIILLDIIMPIMDGFEMLKRLRQHEEIKATPVIILTNLSEAKSAADALAHGVYDFLVKTDWTLDEVVEKVKSRLNGIK